MLATELGPKSAKKSYNKLTSTFGQVIELLFFNLFIFSWIARAFFYFRERNYCMIAILLHIK